MTASAARVQLLTFDLAGEELAVQIERVLEVTAPGAITRIPEMAAYVLGAMSLRGRALPVLDLSQKLGFGATRLGRWTCLVVVEVASAEGRLALGFLADAVNDLVEIEIEDVLPVPPLGTRLPAEYLRGLVARPPRFALWIDAERVLSVAEQVAVAAAPPPNL